MQENFNPQKIKLIVGLGNPGKEYENTYHNVGHLFIEYLKNQKLYTHYSLLMTNCYMNESGGFVKKVLKKYAANPEQLLIVHDDADLALGEFKFSFGRGSAGHKGVESIIKTIRTKGFWRLRIGIRKRELKIRKKAADFVLKKMSSRDIKTLEKIFGEIALNF